MRKIITVKQFDILFDKLDEGLVDEPGDLLDGAYEEWEDRLDFLDKEYIVIGLRPLVNFLKRIIVKLT